MGDEKKFVILVDDNPTNLRIGKHVLSEKYSVATAPSAEKMFSILEHNHPSLILLDIDMPQMNGYEAVSLLKSNPETKGIPVIFLAEAALDSPDKEKGISLGVADYVSKPFDPATFMACVEKYL